jgi:hypothetical protein
MRLAYGVEPASGRLILASRQNLLRGDTALKNLDAPTPLSHVQIDSRVYFQSATTI